MTDHQGTDTDWPPTGPVDELAPETAQGHHADEPDDGSQPSDEDGLFPAPVTAAPRTGVPAVDEALADLEQGARDDDLDAQVAAGERAHRELQARLDDLGTA